MFVWPNTTASTAAAHTAVNNVPVSAAVLQSVVVLNGSATGAAGAAGGSSSPVHDVARSQVDTYSETRLDNLPFPIIYTYPTLKFL